METAPRRGAFCSLRQEPLVAPTLSKDGTTCNSGEYGRTRYFTGEHTQRAHGKTPTRPPLSIAAWTNRSGAEAGLPNLRDIERGRHWSRSAPPHSGGRRQGTYKVVLQQTPYQHNFEKGHPAMLFPAFSCISAFSWSQFPGTACHPGAKRGKKVTHKAIGKAEKCRSQRGSRGFFP